MPYGKKINVLVIPDLFPENETDIKGIFMLSYLRATEKYCNNTFLVLKLSGKQKGIRNEIYSQSQVTRLTVSDKKINKLLKPFYYLKYFSKGCRMAHLHKPFDIIHAHGSILSGTIAWRLSSEMKIPFVITEHVGPFSVVKNNWWKYKWTKFIIEKADAVLNVSEHAKNEISNSGIQMKKSFVTFNPVETGLFIPSDEKSDQFIFAARLDTFKGALRTVRAFRRIYKKFPGWKMVIVGEGEDFLPVKNLTESDAEFSSSVILKGNISRNDLATEMRKSRFLVFPSLHESFGLVAAEALSCGIPVISTNRTAPPEFVNAANGILVNPDNELEISEALEKMIRKYPEYNSGKIRNEIIERFGFENFGEKLFAIYKNIISDFKK